jgi:hypothetical protein
MGMVVTKGTAWGYCPSCKPTNKTPGEKKCFCGVVGCDLTSDWCCACLDARPEEVPTPHKRGRLRLTYRGMHYCPSCVTLKSVMKERKKAVKAVRAQLAGKNSVTERINEVGWDLNCPDSPHIAQGVLSPSIVPESPVAAPIPPVAHRDCLTASTACRIGRSLPSPLHENVGKTSHVCTPDLANAISPVDVTDNEFVFPDKPSSTEVAGGFELVEHFDVAEMRWNETKSNTKWYSILWKY